MFCKKSLSFLCLLSSLMLSSCTDISIKGEGQKKFGPDANYFIGLKLLEAGNENEAAQKFKACIKKGTYYCAMKSAQNLCKIGSVQDKNAACLKLAKDYPEAENLLIAARQLYSAEEISKVIELTENCDLAEDSNELVKLRLEAMRKRGDSRYLNSVFEWFTQRPLSSFHNDFFTEYIYLEPELEKAEQDIIEASDIDDLFSEDFGDQDTESPAPATETSLPKEKRPEDALTQAQTDALNLRILIYRRNYTLGLALSKILLSYFQQGNLPPLPQLCSDIGKAYLYGSQEFLSNAEYFKNLANMAQNAASAYYFWFYAGRFYDKAPRYKTSAKTCFLNAASTAHTPSQKDNALWYYLDISLKESPSQILSAIEKCCHQWSNPYYFDDFFDSLSPILLASCNFDIFGKVYKTIDSFATDEITGQYAYIYARLIEERLISAPASDKKSALERALKSGDSFYYKFLAACKLGFTHQQITEYLSEHYRRESSKDYDKEKAEAAEKLLTGYATFGFPQMIYPEYCSLYKKGISADAAFYLCDFLQRCGAENNSWYVQSIRLAVKACEYSDRVLTPEDLKYLFPEGFSEYVFTEAEKYRLEPQLLFALIRTESFFSTSIISHAGAVGLTQLMPATATDIARRLKKPDFNLEDAQTNISFGSYYFADLVRRCQNDYLSAVFSYNAGITRVRKWLKSSLIGFNKKADMPKDLFLETVPFKETRDYGKKVFSAAIMYDVLYNNDSDISVLFF